MTSIQHTKRQPPERPGAGHTIARGRPPGVYRDSICRIRSISADWDFTMSSASFTAGAN